MNSLTLRLDMSHIRIASKCFDFGLFVRFARAPDTKSVSNLVESYRFFWNFFARWKCSFVMMWMSWICMILPQMFSRFHWCLQFGSSSGRSTSHAAKKLASANRINSFLSRDSLTRADNIGLRHQWYRSMDLLIPMLYFLCHMLWANGATVIAFRIDPVNSFKCLGGSQSKGPRFSLIASFEKSRNFRMYRLWITPSVLWFCRENWLH